MIVTCKKWHVAKRLLREVRQVSNVPTIDFVFDEESTDLPDLGGIQKSLEKRTRHRRALMRMLFDFYETDRMIFCLDPNNMDLLHDFYTDRSRTKLLQIECEFSDEYLLGHAKRVGLIGDHTGDEASQRLLPTIRSDVFHEMDRIKDANFPSFYRIKEKATPQENAGVLAEFLSISDDQASNIAEFQHLFSD